MQLKYDVFYFSRVHIIIIVVSRRLTTAVYAAIIVAGRTSNYNYCDSGPGSARVLFC